MRMAFVGPLPPPVNGFSTICGMMLELLRGKMPVEVFDRAPLLRHKWRSAALQLARPAGFFAACIAHRRMSLYLALSGGRGQLIDLLYVLVSKLFRRAIYVHHHSFSYIGARSSLNRCVFALLRSDSHIVLSQKMGSMLAQGYGLDVGRIKVVSNSAFYAPAEEHVPEHRAAAAPLHIGYLSNITFEKGFVDFFGVMRSLRQRGVICRGYIAGPLAPAARATFEKLLRDSHDVEYLGPLYGIDKEKFYHNLDIFLFPTNYANEAEPLVIYEALRHGVHVIACDRGAIAEMLRFGAGSVFTRDEIVKSATHCIAEFAADRDALCAARRMSLRQAQRIRSCSAAELQFLLADMQNDTRKEDLAGQD